MRVVHVVSAISEEAAGTSYAVVRLCDSLVTEGQDVRLGVLDWTPMASAPRFVKTFPLGLGPRRLGRSPWMARWVAEQARSRSVDIIHNHGLWMMPNVYPGLVARQHNLPLVVSPHGMLSERAMQNGSLVKRLFWPLVQKPALAATSCFHATAESEYEDIRRLGFRQPVAVIPNGIDIPGDVTKQSGDLRTLLFLGRVHPSKGLDMLLPAWKAVQDRFPDWRLSIAGPDNDGHSAQMQDLAQRLQLKRIEFVGAVRGKAKWDTYRNADLFVLPTYSENFGMTVAEALASSVPAIVSKGAPWQGLEKHQAGWWTDVGVEPLVACLNDALSRPPHQLEAMGQRGRAWMQAEFSWRQVGYMMAKTYDWILSGGEKPGWVIED
jgi:glycosyltransferase involved in cell wall biosynthesis